MAATQNRPDPQGSETMTSGPRSRPSGRGRAPRSRIGGAWVALIAAAVVLLFLLIFVLQNGQRVEVSFLGANGTLPMGVALLLAAVFGVLLVALPGTARIIQLRMSRGRGDTGRAGPAEGRPHAVPRTPEPPTPGRPAENRTDRL